LFIVTKNMEKSRRSIRNAGENFRIKVLEPEIRDGKRCKSCHESITDKTKWYNGEQLCDGCKDAMRGGIAWH